MTNLKTGAVPLNLNALISRALKDADFVTECQVLSNIIIGRDAGAAELPTLCQVLHILYCRIQFEESGSLEHAIDAYRTVRDSKMLIPDWLLPAIDMITGSASHRPGRRQQLDARITLLIRAIMMKAVDGSITQEKAAERLGIAKEQLCRAFASHPSIENPWKSARKTIALSVEP